MRKSKSLSKISQIVEKRNIIDFIDDNNKDNKKEQVKNKYRGC